MDKNQTKYKHVATGITNAPMNAQRTKKRVLHKVYKGGKLQVNKKVCSYFDQQFVAKKNKHLHERKITKTQKNEIRSGRQLNLLNKIDLE